MASVKWVDGRLTLKVQEQALNDQENDQFELLEKYEIDGEQEADDQVKVKGNKATFKDDDSEDPTVLSLVPVPSNKTTASVIASQQAKGKTVLFHTKILVEGNETEVVVCREVEKDD